VKVLIVVLVIAVIAALVPVAILVARLGRHSYQRYWGIERQRGAAKQARDAGTDRLKSAERHLLEAERELVTLGEHDQVQAIERLRTKLSTLADRLRYANYGYSPVGSSNPVREPGTGGRAARTRRRTISDAQAIVELAENVSSMARSPTSSRCGPPSITSAPHSTGEER
jgi:hypothetical protein